MWKSNFGQIFLDFWLVSTGFPRYMRQLWFQLVSSVDVGDRCLWSICDACACRVQASVRLFKMLRGIISKVNIFSDWCNVGTDLDCPPLEVLLLTLPLWGFGFFLDFLECCSSLTFWDCYKLFVFDFRADLFRWLGLMSSDATTPLPLKVRRQRQSGPWAWHRQGLFSD